MNALARLCGYALRLLANALSTKPAYMKVESNAECSPWSILQYYWPALVAQWSAHLHLVLEVPGSILVRRDENFGVRHICRDDTK